jgi:hypothetical protein
MFGCRRIYYRRNAISEREIALEILLLKAGEHFLSQIVIDGPQQLLHKSRIS